MKIIVLAGGLSPERDVSLSSGSLIANALIENGHRVLLLDLYRGVPAGETPAYLHQSGEERYEYAVPPVEPDLEALRRSSGNGDSLIGSRVLELCAQADLVFLALHGSIGENGQLQAAFDALGVRYTGTGYVGSLLAMDKDLSKKLMAAAGISTPRWQTVRPGEEADVDVGFPCVAKPCSCGSSVGVSIVRDREGLEKALRAARQYESAVLLEEYIQGREFSVGVLDGRALPVIEIIPREGFYDYKNKYQAGLTREVCPAEIPPELAERLQQAALKVHRTLRLGFYSRVDFLVEEGGAHYCLEANTLPGMTPTSLLPQEAKAAGIGYRELCEAIAAAALQ